MNQNEPNLLKPVGALLRSLYPSTDGKLAWPPLAMLKALLLAVWTDLSGIELAEALDDYTPAVRATLWSLPASRMQRRGLANVAAQVRLSTITYNLQRSHYILARVDPYPKSRSESTPISPFGHHNQNAVRFQPTPPTGSQVSL